MKNIWIGLFVLSCLMFGKMAMCTPKGVSVKLLPTGQKLIVVEDKSLPICFLYVVLKSGTVWDSPQAEGVTHLMSEMLLRGTQTKTRDQIQDELDVLGADIHVDASHESISIVGQTLTRNLDSFLSLFSDVILNPSFDSKELEKLKREEIANLKQIRENDQALVARFFSKALYQKHPYAMSPGGKESTLQKITISKIQEVYKKIVVGGNMLFAASGDLDAKVIGAKLNQYFKNLPKGSVPEFEYPNYSKNSGKEILLVDKPDRTQTQIILGHLGIDVLNPDYFNLLLANNAFGGGFTARLMQEVRVKRGWSYGAYSWFRARKKPGEFAMMLFPASKDTVDAVKLVLDLYKDYAQNGITKEEFELSKSNLINEFSFKIDTARKRVSQMIMIEMMGLPQDYLETYQDKIKSVSLEEVNAAIKKYSDPKNLVITILCTASDFKNKLKSLGDDVHVTIKKYTDEE